jgi:hypothetical protein
MKPMIDQTGRQPTFNLQIYEQQKQQPPPQPTMPLPPGMIPQLNYQYPGYHPTYNNIPQMIPIVNNYKINAMGPLDNHTKMSYIYEDILPPRGGSMTQINSLDERIHMYEFIRSVLIKEKKDMLVLSQSQNSLLNYIKFMDLNPYNTNIHSTNPYLGLPNDMLLYRSCYPIRYNSNTSSIMCAKDSTAVNIRIYKVTDVELNVFYNKNKQALQQLEIALPHVVGASVADLNVNNYDIWREVGYYEFVREQIIKKRVSPNFVILYMYNIALTPFIDYIQLAKLRGCSSKPDSNKPKSLVMITESPTHNLYGWASNSYKKDFNINKMVHAGFYSDKIWYSVLFQIMAALCTMQKYGFIFNQFSIEDHVYIKDLPIDASNIKYWKYKINGVDYYIPNYGYLVVIDSKYKDLESNHLHSLNTHSGTYRIYADTFGDDKNKIEQECFDVFKRIFTKNSFSEAFKQNGGVTPPDTITSFLDSITTIINAPSSKTATSSAKIAADAAVKLAQTAVTEAAAAATAATTAAAEAAAAAAAAAATGATAAAEAEAAATAKEAEKAAIMKSNAASKVAADKVADLANAEAKEAADAQVNNIGYFMERTMCRFMHNRIGTLLKTIETKFIRKEDMSDMSKGEIVVYEYSPENFKFVMYSNIDRSSEGTHLVFSKYDPSDAELNPTKMIISVPGSKLYKYSAMEPITQNYKSGEVNFNEDNLLEVYVL